jgi:hypothetical protein
MASFVLNFDCAISYGLFLWIYQTQISQLIYMTPSTVTVEQSIMYALIMYYCRMTVLLNLKRRV